MDGSKVLAELARPKRTRSLMNVSRGSRHIEAWQASAGSFSPS